MYTPFLEWKSCHVSITFMPRSIQISNKLFRSDDESKMVEKDEEKITQKMYAAELTSKRTERKVDLSKHIYLYELDSRHYEVCFSISYYESFKFVFLKAFRSRLAPRMSEWER